MKENYKKLMRMALALCLAVVMLCGATTDAHAAGSKKSFTKTATLKGGQQCLLTMKLKKRYKVKMTISTTSKKKDLNIQAVAPRSQSASSYTSLNSKKRKNSVTVDLPKGTNILYITNYGMSKAKVKIKLSAKGKVLRFVRTKTTTGDIG